MRNATTHGGVDDGYRLRLLGQNGGQMDLTDCAFTGSGRSEVHHPAGSSGMIDHCVGNWYLEMSSPAVTVTNGSGRAFADVSASGSILNSTLHYVNLNGGTPTMQGNTLNDDRPFRITAPDVG